MKPEPEDYCDRAEKLLQKINETAPRFKNQFQLISDAVSCFYVAIEKRQTCKTNNDIAGMRAWMEIIQSLQCLGVNEIITVLSQRKKEEETKAAQEAEARNFIRRIVGDSIVGDVLQLRTFLRCNNGQVSDFGYKK